MKHIMLILTIVFSLFFVSNNVKCEEGVKNTITLAWDANTEVDLLGYILFRSEKLGGPYERVNDEIITATEYMDIIPPLVKTRFYYVIVATNGPLTSDYSNEVTTLINTAKIAVPAKNVRIIYGK